MFTRFSNQGTSTTGRFARRMFIISSQKLYRKISGHVYVTCCVYSKLQVLLHPPDGDCDRGKGFVSLTDRSDWLDLNGSLSLSRLRSVRFYFTCTSACCADLAKLSLLSASRALEKRPIFGHSLKNFCGLCRFFLIWRAGIPSGSPQHTASVTVLWT